MRRRQDPKVKKIHAPKCFPPVRPALSEAKKYVIIAGVGRSGTTFLTHLLTALGLPTGFGPGDCEGAEKSACRAGLERVKGSPRDAYITKDPEYSLLLREMLEEGLEFEHVYVPFRDLAQAAGSRVKMGKGAGGLWRVTEAKQQEQKLQEILLRLLCQLEECEIPHTMLDYPRFVLDSAYTYERLKFLMEKFGVESGKFQEVFSRISKPELAHEY